MGAIQLTDVVKRFGTTEVIPDLTLRIEPGAFTVFLGPSGCGKSTLLRMIAGLESLSDGEISIGGQRVDHLPPGQRGVAMVFQTYALYPHMSVRENMAFGLRNIGRKPTDIAARVTEAARVLEIEHLLDRKPGQLSGGQRQRVAIGRAIVKEPQAFLFDEPLSNLDAALRARTRVEIARLHQRLQATMIFVTHDQVEAMTLATQIVVLNKGRIEQMGAPLDIYRRPATRFVASFIGSPSMNFLDAATLPGGAEFASRVQLPASLAGSPLTLGVRPDALRVDGDGRLEGQVEVIEHLGDRTHLYTMLSDGNQIVVQDGGESAVRIGDRIRIGVDPAQLHLFDHDGRAYHAS